jgi:predicted dehydrogenase
MFKVGVIGYGERINTVVEGLVKTGEVQLCAIMDINNEAVKERFPGIPENVVFYNDAREMLDKEKLDGVCIGTRCSLHTKYAALVSEYNLPMFLEKPVCTNYDDLNVLENLPKEMDDKTVVSFPLRNADIVLKLKELIDEGKLGEITQVQGYNNVPYARGYYHKWYRDENETGGLFLQKATHDLDYINFLLGTLNPVCVAGMKSKQIFKGTKPAGLKCKDCDEAETCPESPANVHKTGDYNIPGEYCCFAVDTGNEDSGTAIVRYDNGLHVVYTQNFIARLQAKKRGARIIGYKGTAEFDFYTGDLILYSHEAPTVEKVEVDTSKPHFGGDDALFVNFVGVMKGAEKSKTPLREGILSAKMCLAAKKSSDEKVFVEI